MLEPDRPAVDAVSVDGEVRPIAEIEEELIRFALSFYHGQMSEVARRLGIGRSTLYRKLKDYAIDPMIQDSRRLSPCTQRPIVSASMASAERCLKMSVAGLICFIPY
jgi:AraC-like DNA-binding protein